MSVLLVLSTVFVWGPLLIKHIPIIILFFADILVLIWAFSLKPVYLPQAHLGEREKQANNNKKNKLIITVLLMQGIAWQVQLKVVILYSGLGVLTGVISVYIEQANQWRKERKVTK